MSINLSFICSSHVWSAVPLDYPSLSGALDGLSQERGRSISNHENPTYWLLDGGRRKKKRRWRRVRRMKRMKGGGGEGKK